MVLAGIDGEADNSQNDKEHDDDNRDSIIPLNHDELLLCQWRQSGSDRRCRGPMTAADAGASNALDNDGRNLRMRTQKDENGARTGNSIIS